MYPRRNSRDKETEGEKKLDSAKPVISSHAWNWMMTMIQVPWSWTWTTFHCQQRRHLAASCPSCLTSRVRTRSRLAASLKWSDCAASGPATTTRLESVSWRYDSTPPFPRPSYGQVAWGLMKLDTPFSLLRTTFETAVKTHLFKTCYC